MVKAIIFDCFGVLYQSGAGSLYNMAPAERHQAITDVRTKFDYGYITLREYFEELAELTDTTYEEMVALSQNRHVRVEAMFALARELRSNYKVALLTNMGKGVLDERFTKEEQAELFDEIIVSSSVGLAKPNPAIFEFAAQRLGIEPEACVMIDDLAANCEGAEMAGMRAVQHTSAGLTREKLTALGVEGL